MPVITCVNYHREMTSYQIYGLHISSSFLNWDKTQIEHIWKNDKLNGESMDILNCSQFVESVFSCVHEIWGRPCSGMRTVYMCCVQHTTHMHTSLSIYIILVCKVYFTSIVCYTHMCLRQMSSLVHKVSMILAGDAKSFPFVFQLRGHQDRYLTWSYND